MQAKQSKMLLYNLLPGEGGWGACLEGGEVELSSHFIFFQSVSQLIQKKMLQAG